MDRSNTLETPHLDKAEITAADQYARARQHYLEHNGDTKVTNTYLRIAVSCLAALALFLGISNLLVVKAYRNLKPLVIRIDSVGHAQAIKYDDMTYKPQDKEMRYFLARFVQLYYSRNHYTVASDFPKAFNFLDATLARNVMQMHEQRHDVTSFMTDPNAPNTTVQINQITLDQIQRPPYQATVDFTASQTLPYSTQVVAQRRYTATFQFLFRPDQVTNNMVTTNPLGFTIVYFHDQQAFTTE